MSFVEENYVNVVDLNEGLQFVEFTSYAVSVPKNHF